ncbi:MAG: DUF4388 domain-containing protein [Chloroflexi bacterium]|nr:MAG: DUF4388 domain-containing protein [Chloroflexota bacterium]
MALKGNLRDFNTSQLLNLINLAHKTGKLTIDGHDSQGVVLYFKDGRLIRASQGSDSKKLTDILVQAGKLSPDQAHAVNSRVPSNTDRAIGRYLLEHRLISRDDIIQGVKDYMLNIVYDLFTWKEGNFVFEQDVLPDGDKLVIPLNLDNVILEGSRRIQESEKLYEELPDLGSIALKITDKPLKDVKLTQDDWRVISHIHPRNTVKQIAQNTNMDEFQIRKIVYGMLQAGLVELVRPDGFVDRRQTPAYERRERRGVGQTPAEKRSVVTKLIERIKRI